MLISGGILTMPQVITGFILANDFSGIWIIWSALIGGAFGSVFFSHLWYRLPIKTENELILFRFSGKGAKILHAFRSVYVGGIVAPLGLSMAFVAFGRIISMLFELDFSLSVLIILGFVIISTFFNSLRQRLKLDVIYLIIFLVSLGIIIFYLTKNLGGFSSISEIVQSKQYNFNLIPEPGTLAFGSFLVFVLIQWWSAGIIDMPDINGQKLMSAKNINTVSKSVILPSVFMSVFLVIILTIPFYSLKLDNSLLKGSSGELAFVSIFKYAIPKNLYFVVVIFFFLPFLSSVNNTQNWSASLLVQNFYKYHINKQATEQKLSGIGTVMMILIALISATIALFNDSILDIFKYLLAISAGVGPVFILRWYWHRINAWSQLSAMVLSLIYPNIYEILFANSPAFQNFIETLMTNWCLEYFPLKIILLSIAVIASWLLATFLTIPTDEKTVRKFVNAVKPGGFWKNEQSGKVFFYKRFLIAILLTFAGFTFYFTYWQFVNGEYLTTVLCFVMYITLNYLGYILLKRINHTYAA